MGATSDEKDEDLLVVLDNICDKHLKKWEGIVNKNKDPYRVAKEVFKELKVATISLE